MKPLDTSLELERLTWPLARLDEAIEWLTRKAGLYDRTVEIPAAPPATADSEVLLDWIDAAARTLGIEAEPIDCAYADAEALLQNAGPALLQIRAGSEIRFFAVLAGNARRVSLLTPALASERVDLEIVRAWICNGIEAPLLAENERMLQEAGVPNKGRANARKAILRQQLGGARVTDCWLLRLPPGASLWRQVREAGVPSRVLAL